MSSLSLETMFSCSMEIPGTQFSLKKKTMYMARNTRINADQVSEGHRFYNMNAGVLMVMLSAAVLIWNTEVL